MFCKINFLVSVFIVSGNLWAGPIPYVENGTQYALQESSGGACPENIKLKIEASADGAPLLSLSGWIAFEWQKMSGVPIENSGCTSATTQKIKSIGATLKMTKEIEASCNGENADSTRETLILEDKKIHYKSEIIVRRKGVWTVDKRKPSLSCFWKI